MEEVCFLDEIKKLKMSSKEAVDHTDDFGKFSKYMHVERNIEFELLNIINTSISSDKGRLILVCGSAGDGKSHLVSFIMDKHPEFKGKITVHNDATESFEPRKTSMETLKDVLINFSDENIENTSEVKILLINLGTLTNFIDSEQGRNFKKLRDYINKNNILVADIVNDKEIIDDRFAYINFSDYHMYSLTPAGVDSQYIYNLLDKVVSDDLNNPFYQGFIEKCSVCHNRKKCPIKENYSLLLESKVKQNIALKLIEIIVKEKASITTRAVLNFIYDIIVHPSFNTLTRDKLVKKIERLTLAEFIDSLTANIMFINKDSSRIIKLLGKVDPINFTNEDLDGLIASLNRGQSFANKYIEKVYSNKEAYLVSLLNDEFSVKQIIDDPKISKSEIKCKIINHYIRMDYLKNGIKGTIYEDKLYKDYLKYLYLYNSNNIVELGELYDKVSEAIYKWDNIKTDDNKIKINVGKRQSKFKVLQKLDLESLEEIEYKKITDGKIDKFRSNIQLDFIVKGSSGMLSVKLDFQLYKLLSQIRYGYIPKKSDKNNFISFIDAVEEIKKSALQDKELYFNENTINGTSTYKFTKKFGKYKFVRLEI